MKLAVQADVCIGCGVCESVCSDVFEMKDNVAVMKQEIVPPENAAAARQAVNDCPVTAILITEE
jgi:ferredoxin